MKAAARTYELGGVAGTSYDRWLLDHHWDEQIVSVDLEVRSDAKWKIERADDILDHLVRALDGQGAVATVELAQVFVIQSIKRLHGLKPLEWVELVDPAKP